MIEVDAIWYDLVFARKCVIYVPSGRWRNSYATVEPSLPPLDDRVGKTIKMLTGIGCMEGSHVYRFRELKNAEREDRRHRLMEMYDIELFSF
tara:strand:- start:497 stop:772 length:276 start_codon:yes stop_codon:yes gene_type:complete